VPTDAPMYVDDVTATISPDGTELVIEIRPAMP
jgi:hypothetical protein